MCKIELSEYEAKIIKQYLSILCLKHYIIQMYLLNPYIFGIYAEETKFFKYLRFKTLYDTNYL